MSRESLVFLLGALIFITPVLGVPPVWKEYSLLIIGGLLVLIGFSLRRSAYYRKLDRGNGEMGNDSFVESLPERERLTANSAQAGSQTGLPDLSEHTPEEAAAEMEK